MSLNGKEIYRCYDGMGPIQIIDNGDYRYMTFGGNEQQSCLLRSNPALLQHDYARAMMLVLLFIEPKELLFFGLGGGCMATCLHHNYPQSKLTAIELRQAVIDAAYQYFRLPEDERLEVLNMDIQEYFDEVESMQADIIFSDIYSAVGVDDQQLTLKYVEECHRLLSNNGWLVMNFWSSNRKKMTLFDAVYDCFADVRVCTTGGGNWLLFAGKKVNEQSSEQLKRSANTLSVRLGFSVLNYLNQLQKCIAPTKLSSR